VPKRRSILGDVRPNSVLSDHPAFNTRSPCSPRGSPQPTTSDGRVSRHRGCSTRRSSRPRTRSPSSPRRRSHFSASNRQRSESRSPPPKSRRRPRSPSLDTTPLGTHLDYEYSPQASSVDSQIEENSLDEYVTGLDDNLPRNHPLRVAINATGLPSEDPPDLRYSIRNQGTKARNLHRRVKVLHSDANSEIPIEAANSRRKNKTLDWIPDRENIMKKLWTSPPSLKRQQRIEGPPPSEDYFAECDLCKKGFETLPGCWMQQGHVQRGHRGNAYSTQEPDVCAWRRTVCGSQG
jgi:hypothetical protein